MSQDIYYPKLVVVAAPSGAGKTTLCSLLLREFPDQFVLSISSTTRSPRPNEQNGREYHFLSVPAFKELIQKNRFAEWAMVHGNYYGTAKDTIEDAFRRGKSVILDIDVQGAANLKTAFPDRFVSIFVAPPDLKELEKRLRNRGTESEESLQRRLENAREEMRASKDFDHFIVNQDLQTAYSELRKFVQEKLRC